MAPGGGFSPISLCGTCRQLLLDIDTMHVPLWCVYVGFLLRSYLVITKVHMETGHVSVLALQLHRGSRSITVQ